jgi:hypothetical protein
MVWSRFALSSRSRRTDVIVAIRPFQSSRQTISPIELDLTSNGVQTIGQSTGVHFDYPGSGFMNVTGWPAPQDGLLVLPDANGKITKGSQLFASSTLLPIGTLVPNGFAALAALDSNHDGVIDDAKGPCIRPASHLGPRQRPTAYPRVGRYPEL